jgi:hypothetical protein
VTEGGVEMGTFPLTNELFAVLIGEGLYDPIHWSTAGAVWLAKARAPAPAYWNQAGYDHPDQPATGVNYYEAEAAANLLSKINPNGSVYDLPTEAEWEAASSNGRRDPYPWGGDAVAIPDVRANLSFFGEFRLSGITPVDAFPLGRSAAGVWDLLGNCSEWAKATPDTGGLGGVLRGGCFWSAPATVDCTYRDVVPPTVRDNQTSIRLVRRARRSGDPVECSAPSATVAHTRPIPRPSRPFRQEGIPTDLSAASWRLKVNGLVERPQELSLSDLTDVFPQAVRGGLFVCVCRWGAVNEVRGVLLSDILAAARPVGDPRNLFVRLRSVAGPTGRAYESTVPLADVVAHDALVCHTLDGSPLSLDVGWPARFWAFHLYAYKQVKCLAELTVTDTFEAGWWEVSNDYDLGGRIQPGRITVIGKRPHKLDIAGTAGD